MEATLAAKRVIDMFDNTYSACNPASSLVATNTEVLAWIATLVEKEVTKISKHLDELARRRGLRPNTLKAYLTSSYIPFFVWHRLFSGFLPQPTPDSQARLHLVLKALVASWRKSAKKTMTAETKTVEELISTKQWPEGGMAELQDAFLDRLPSILEAFNGVTPYRHNQEFYLQFMAQMMMGKSSFSTTSSSSSSSTSSSSSSSSSFFLFFCSSSPPLLLTLILSSIFSSLINI